MLGEARFTSPSSPAQSICQSKQWSRSDGRRRLIQVLRSIWTDDVNPILDAALSAGHRMRLHDLKFHESPPRGSFRSGLRRILTRQSVGFTCEYVVTFQLPYGHGGAYSKYCL
jgi:hypothetical protein